MKQNLLTNFKNKYGVNPLEFFNNKENYKDISDIDFEKIKKELEYLRDDVLCELYVAKIISDFLKENNQYFLPRGTLSNSYILYKLGITNVNLDKYELPREVLFGLKGEKTFSIDVNVATSFKSKLISFIKDKFNGDLYSKMFVDKNGNLSCFNGSMFLIKLEDEENFDVLVEGDNKYIKEDFHKLMESHLFVSLNILEFTGLDDLNYLKEKCGEPNVDVFTDKKIIDNFFKYQNIGGIDQSIAAAGFYYYDALFNGCDPLLMLSRVSGAMHSTDVLWNAKERGVYWNYIDTLKYPLTRDEIILKCINWVYPIDEAYEVMEYVRKGKTHRNEAKESSNAWKKIKEKLEDAFSEDYADYLSNIEYIFPLGHAMEYAIYYFNLMYYKVYYYDEFFKIKTKDIKEYLNLSNEELYNLKKKYKEERDFNMVDNITLLIENNLSKYQKNDQ